jgi:hypothetical protein
MLVALDTAGAEHSALLDELGRVVAELEQAVAE